MKKIFLISFFGIQVQGVRAITSYLDAHGLDVRLCILKDFRVRPLAKPKPQTTLLECIVNGKLMSSQRDQILWSATEQALLDEQLREFRPDIIGISAPSWFDKHAPKFIAHVKDAIGHQAPVVVGGLGPTFTPEAYAPYCDVVVQGAGEEAVRRLCALLPSRDPAWKTIPNVCYMENGVLVQNPILLSSSSLEKAPPPYYGPRCVLIEDEAVSPEPMFRDATYHTFVGRGCLGKCSFCATGISGSIINGKRRIIRNMEQVFKELEHAKSIGFSKVHFFDEHFTFPIKTFTKFFMYYRENIHLPFIAQLHPVQIVNHPGLLDTLIDAGLTHSVVAVQSASKFISEKVYARNLNEDLIFTFAEMLSERGVEVIYQFITANPYENEEHFAENIEFIKKIPFKHGMDTQEVYRLALFPGAPLGQRIQSEGVAVPDGKKFLYRGYMHFLACLVPSQELEALQRDNRYKQAPHLLGDYIHRLMESAQERCRTALAAPIGEEKESMAYARRYLKDAAIVNAAQAVLHLKRKELTQASACLKKCFRHFVLQGDDPSHPIAEFGMHSGLGSAWTNALVQALNDENCSFRTQEAALMVGSMLVRENRLDEAYALLSRYHAFAPEASHLRYMLGEVLLRLSRNEELTRLYKPQAVLDCHGYMLALMCACAFTALQRKKEALQVIAQIERHGYSLEKGLRKLHGRFCNDAGQHAAAPEFHPWRMMQSVQAGICFMRAELLRQAERFSEAEAQFRIGLEMDPDNIVSLRALGDVLVRQGQFEEAQKLFERILALKPEFYDVYINLASVLRKMRRFEDALTVLDKLETLAPQTRYIKESRNSIMQCM